MAVPEETEEDELRDEPDSAMAPELLERFRRGEPQALEAVYRQHIERVERMVRAGPASSRDLTRAIQDVFLTAFSRSARAGYDGRRAYGSHLLGAATGALGDRIPAARPPARRLPPGTEALVARYLAALPVELRAVHHRRFVLAESERRAAQVLGISRPALGAREKQLVAGLRRELRDTNMRALRDDDALALALAGGRLSGAQRDRILAGVLRRRAARHPLQRRWLLVAALVMAAAAAAIFCYRAAG